MTHVNIAVVQAEKDRTCNKCGLHGNKNIKAGKYHARVYGYRASMNICQKCIEKIYKELKQKNELLEALGEQKN